MERGRICLNLNYVWWHLVAKLRTTFQSCLVCFQKWTKELCREDSDGDGRTNGQELGDPDCTWKVGMNLVNVSGLSHPGEFFSTDMQFLE